MPRARVRDIAVQHLAAFRIGDRQEQAEIKYLLGLIGQNPGCAKTPDTRIYLGIAILVTDLEEYRRRLVPHEPAS